jgi:DNA polymerase-3 subunit gamma/tau
MVRRRSPKAWAVVREASVRDVHGDEIVLLFQHLVHANMLSAQAELLTDAVREVLGGTWHIRAELGGADGAGTPTGSAPPAHTPPGSSSAPPTAVTAKTEAADGDWPTLTRPGGSARAEAAEPASAPAQAPKKAARRGGARAAQSKGAQAAVPGPAARAEAGFDPGDEPLDDGPPDDGPGNVRESSEEQAMRGLSQHFDIERIGGDHPRP